ncbi:hypothetical protein EV356DRAFT_576579 [Viridothelium virens]|uniref:Uncharacterized protein n=1 Tax=Viridothelium virens TaxID=1048519 RepID=A0A6A6H978_VIRVR|nr:hypothetical protein EV356DRAFT_576579 [Viridothelium virens]
MARAKKDDELKHPLIVAARHSIHFGGPGMEFDNPGFDNLARSDADILQCIASCLAILHEDLTFDYQLVELSGIVELHSINDYDRVNAAKSWSVQALVGEDKMEKCTPVTSKWALEDADTAEKREMELMEN